jgi:hypothetical protein
MHWCQTTIGQLRILDWDRGCPSTRNVVKHVKQVGRKSMSFLVGLINSIDQSPKKVSMELTYNCFTIFVHFLVRSDMLIVR